MTGDERSADGTADGSGARSADGRRGRALWLRAARAAPRSEPGARALPHVAYLMLGGLGGLTPDQALQRWPGTVRLLGALAATGEVTVSAYWRTPHGSSPVRRDLEGVVHHFIGDRRRTPWRLAAAVSAARPDVVHQNGFVFPIATLLLRAGQLRARPVVPGAGRRPVVLVQHHGEAPLRGRTARAQRVAAWAADGYLFTGGEGQAATWRAAGLLRPSVAVHPVLEASTLLVPEPVDHARRLTGMYGEPAVVWVGRLIEGKDPLTALAGFAGAFCSPDAPSSAAQLWMVCTDRDLEGQLRARLAAGPADLRRRVHLVGPVPAEEMASWYSAADLYLSSSRREGSGYALIEALACGCTPVVTDIPPHLAIAAPLGRRFGVGDVAAAADALRSAAYGPSARAQAQAHFVANLGWERVVADLLEAYRPGRIHPSRR